MKWRKLYQNQGLLGHSKEKNSGAKSLDASQRRAIALSLLSGKTTVREMSAKYNVSRKFLREQMDKANEGLACAFKEKLSEDKEVLFTIAVTKHWLKLVTLSLALECKSAYRGIQAFFNSAMEHSVSIGTIHNTIQEVIPTVKTIHNKERLCNIVTGGHDEMFQSGLPLLAGIDLKTFYCYLLEHAQHRDADTWAIHLLEATEKGFAPEQIVADFGTGLRAGQKIALPGVPCLGDNFHALQEITKVARFFEHRAYRHIKTSDKLDNKMAKAKKKQQGRKYGHKLKQAREKEAQAIQQYDTLNTLLVWLREDILSVSGMAQSTRGKLYDFFVECLQDMAQSGHKRLKQLLTFFSNQKRNLLMFVDQIMQHAQTIAEQLKVPLYAVQQLFTLIKMPDNTTQYWQLDAQLRHQTKDRFHQAYQAVSDALKNIFRASSLVENLNGRLRDYFDLRRHVGKDYLQLLRFFLNHQVFQRSRIKERDGKSPAELLHGQSHKHWLELLGFQRFSKSASA